MENKLYKVRAGGRYETGIDTIIIYGGGQILLKKNRDFFKMQNGEMLFFYLKNEPKNARKENLNRKDNYFLKYDDIYGSYYKERKTALYIHESEIKVSGPVEKLSFEHDGEKNYKNEYNLYFVNGGRKRVLNVEKLNVPGNWTIPKEEVSAGAHWYNFLGDYNNSYEIVTEEEQKRLKNWRTKKGLPAPEPYNLKHWYFTEEDFSVNTVESDYYTRTEYDAARIERNKLASRFNEILGHNKGFSHYDIQKLLNVFDITEKKNGGL